MDLHLKATANLLSHLSGLLHMPQPELNKRYVFTNTFDAQHWLAGTQGLIPVISDSPIDVLGARFGYAGLIKGDDAGGSVEAWIVPAKDLPLDDIKNGRVRIYGAGGIRDDDVYTFMPDDITQYLGAPVTDKSLVIKNPGHEDQSVHNLWKESSDKVKAGAQKVERVVYHGTFKDAVAQIKKQGLKPQPASKRSYGESMSGDSFYAGVRAKRVFVTTSLSNAQDYAQNALNSHSDWTSGRINKAVVVLRVRIPAGEKLENDDKDPTGTAFMLPQIKSEWIEEVGLFDQTTGKLREKAETVYYVPVLIEYDQPDDKSSAYPQPLDPTELVTIGDDDERVVKNVPGGHDQTMHGQRYGDGFRPDMRAKLSTAVDRVRKAGGHKAVYAAAELVKRAQQNDFAIDKSDFEKWQKLGLAAKLSDDGMYEIDMKDHKTRSFFEAVEMWDSYYNDDGVDWDYKSIGKRVQAWADGNKPDPGLDIMWAAAQLALPKTVTLYRGIQASEVKKEALLGTKRDTAVQVGPTAHWSNKRSVSESFGKDILFTMKVPREGILFCHKLFNGGFENEQEYNPVFRNPPKIKTVKAAPGDSGVKVTVELEFLPWKPKKTQ